MKIFKRFLLALSTGYILYFYSERIFWSFLHPGDTLIGNFFGWLQYSFFAYALLIIIDEFRARNIWSIFIAGAAFGWIGEGIYAMTLFETEVLPFFNLSWTGLAWHALISVLIGWYYLRKILEENRYLKIIVFSLLMGVFWGVWSVAWVLETPPIVTTPDIYLLHGLLITALFILSQWIFSKSNAFEFHATRKQNLFVLIILTASYLAITVPYMKAISVILPVLFYLLYLILKKNKKSEQPGSVLTEIGKPVRWRSLLLLFIMPITAALIYNAMNAAGLIFRTNLFIAIISTAAGFIMFAVSAVKIFRQKNP